MSATLFFTLLLFIFTATTTTTVTATTTSSENLISSLKSKNITSVHLVSPNPETISLFSHSNISVLLSIPNSLIPTISSNSSATSAWLSTHVTPFLPHVRIYAISVGNNVTDASLLKLVVTAIDNVKEKVKELGIERVNVSTTVSLGFLTGSSESAKGLLSSLYDRNIATLFMNVEPWKLLLEITFVEVVCDVSTEARYEIMDDGVVEARILKFGKDMVKKDGDNNYMLFLRICICHIIFFIVALCLYSWRL